EAEDHSNVLLVATIEPVAAAPTLVGDDDTNTITGLTEIHEYKIDAGEWTVGTTAPDLSGSVVVQIRVKATASALASEIQTINFTAGPVFFENFASYATGTKTGTALAPWVISNSGTYRTVYTIKAEDSNQYLEIRNGADVLTTPTFPSTDHAVVEWKVRVDEVSNFLVTGYGATTGAGDAVMRLILSTSSGNTILRGYPQDGNA